MKDLLFEKIMLVHKQDNNAAPVSDLMPGGTDQSERQQGE